jgi:glutathione S-transferase
LFQKQTRRSVLMPFFLFLPSSPYAINRYLNETKRLYSVLESALEKSEYLAGPTYGIADIKAFGWVRIAPRTGVELAPFPKLTAWLKKIEERPAVKEGLAVPRS